MAAAAIPFPISVEEYLHSVYEPDMDYVDGSLEDRNVGEFDHWRVQRALFEALVKGEKQFSYYVIQETRTQINATRYRVPDTCLVRRSDLPKRIIRNAPLLCVEVLSPEDRFARTAAKCQDYLRMGVPEVWIIDPEKRAVHVLRGDGTVGNGTVDEVLGGRLHLLGTTMEIQVSDLFSSLDEE